MENIYEQKESIVLMTIECLIYTF